MKGVKDSRETKAGEDTTFLATWKTPLDDQITLTATKKADWEAKKTTADEKQATVVTKEAELTAA
jgi:hypothetical protein